MNEQRYLVVLMPPAGADLRELFTRISWCAQQHGLARPVGVTARAEYTALLMTGSEHQVQAALVDATSADTRWLAVQSAGAVLEQGLSEKRAFLRQGRRG